MRGATAAISEKGGAKCFNSRPSCEGRREKLARLPVVYVSIHAPRARGDTQSKGLTAFVVVSIHAPRARGDHFSPPREKQAAFQFTPLVRGATCAPPRADPTTRRFNSRPSCEGRPSSGAADVLAGVSIHAPRARGDRKRHQSRAPPSFNSRPSCEGRLFG